MANETLFEFEGQKTGRETAMLLHELADGLADGTSVELADDEWSVTIDAPAELSVEIELELERETDEDVDSVELELELEWETTADESTTTAPENDAGEGTVESAEATDPERRGESSTDTEITAGGESKSLARFQVFRDRADEWRWRLVHRNGNIIATSGEGYTTRRNAEKGLDSVVANAPGADVEDEF